MVLSTQVRGPFKENSVVLSNLKPFRVYCLQTEAQLTVQNNNCRPGLSLSNVSCHETTADGKTRLRLSIVCAEKLLLNSEFRHGWVAGGRGRDPEVLTWKSDHVGVCGSKELL